VPSPGDEVSAAPAGTLRRDGEVMGLVGSAHFTSHFFQLTLPPLFPLLRDEFEVSYAALGLLVSLMYAASGIGQPVAGFLVDRWGARRVLLTGMAVLAGAMAAAALSPSYWLLVPAVLVAGMGNAVFHPADYAILNATVHPRRLGRAYSVHGIGGSLGYASAPVAIVALSGLWGWRGALLAAGAGGIALTALVASRGEEPPGPAAAQARGDGGARPGLLQDIRSILVAPILLAFAYFVLQATALIGVHTFAVTALAAIYEAPLALATGALTAFLLGRTVGMVAGGVLADRTGRHDVVAGVGLSVTAGLMLLVAAPLPTPAALPALLAVAGACFAATNASRDLLVRSATPHGSTGKVYGFVYSGLDLGSSVTPFLFGWLLDRGEPRAMFAVVAGLLLVGILTVVQVRRRAPPRPRGDERGRTWAVHTSSRNGGEG
jgi:MFS transporter, FSR family, fosmidomycin resistance protein